MLTPATSGRYISIKADGKLHETVTENTDGAVLREYELKDGTKGSKWELLYKDISGIIKNIEFQTGDYGENLLITFTNGEDEITLSQGTNTPFGEDILKKLPNVDLAEKATFAPYSFTDEKGKERRGVTIYQKSDKVSNFFWDTVKNDVANGYPPVNFEKEKATSDDWKIYYLQARKFLTAYVKDNVLPKVGTVEQKPAPVGLTDEEFKEIPF